MVTALYRRYRPQTFAELIGQAQVTTPLMTALRTDRVNHAYLFSGPRGCGKTTSARILARCLNCAEGPTDTPCGKCPSCVELSRDGGGSLDVVEIDAASHNGVEDARDLRERAIFAPARDRFKIFILDEAHMVTPQGFNALLKIVEEPPAHIKFIFATTEPEKVIGTIRSRTHHYPFRLVPPAQMLEYLEQLCESEGVKIEAGVLTLVVRAGGGSVRDSLSLLDQLIAGSDGGLVTYDLAVALLGYTHANVLNAVVDAFAAADGAGVFENVDKVIQTGQDPRRFVEDLLEHLRNLIIVLSAGDGAAGVLRGVAQDELAKMTEQAYRFGLAQLTHATQIIAQSLSQMTGATSPRLHLELMCAKVLVPAADKSEVGSLARIERLERRIGFEPAVSNSSARDTQPAVIVSPPVAVPSTPVAVPSTPAAAPAAAPVATAASATPVAPVGLVTTAQVKAAWPDIMTALTKSSRATWALAQSFAVVDYTDGVLTLLFQSAGDLDAFKKAAGAPDKLRQAIEDVLGIRVQFKPSVAAAAAPAAAPADDLPAPAPVADDLPAPAPAVVAAPTPKAAPAPAPKVEVAPEPEFAPEPEPEFDTQPAPAESEPTAKSGRSSLVHEGAEYGEAVLREILGAEPVDEPKQGK